MKKLEVKRRAVNSEILEELKKSRMNLEKFPEEERDKDYAIFSSVTDELAAYLRGIVVGVVTKSNFRGYSWIDDWKEDIVIHLMLVWPKFDEERAALSGKAPNPFSYFTMVARNRALSLLKTELKVIQTGKKMYHDPSSQYYMGEDGLEDELYVGDKDEHLDYTTKIRNDRRFGYRRRGKAGSSTSTLGEYPETIRRNLGRLIDEYIAKGGKITVCEPGTSVVDISEAKTNCKDNTDDD